MGILLVLYNSDDNQINNNSFNNNAGLKMVNQSGD